jgi:hypothetical protein
MSSPPWSNQNNGRVAMTFLYLTSDKMGEGEPELGRKLLKSFLE